MNKKTILFASMNSIGHVNSMMGIANCLKKRGHRTVFLFHEPINCQLQKDGHEVYDCCNDGLIASDASLEMDKAVCISDVMDKFMRDRTIENFIEFERVSWKSKGALVSKNDARFKRKLDLIKPDVIVVDHFYIQPAILKYGKPWAQIFSPSPLALHPPEHNLPPSFYGLPTNWLEEKDQTIKDEYLEFKRQFDALKIELATEWAQYLASSHQINVDPVFIRLSPYLNVYYYPEELDYDQPLKDWVRCDSILRVNSNYSDNNTTVQEDKGEDLERSQSDYVIRITAELENKNVKLIFLSMGTLVSSNVDLMKLLISILSKCPHRFIVSMGTNWNKYDLAPNMWGQRYVDQLSILPLIDLIITHGGNNTITECFYYGVPGFIVCPSFGDQLDNAQRIEECKLGKRIDPFKTTEVEFLKAIEVVLKDETIRPRMKGISKRMQLPENRYRALKIFTEFVEGTNL